MQNQITFLFGFHFYCLVFKSDLVWGNFNCDSNALLEDKVCRNELQCVYHEDFENDHRLCRCQITITALSLPVITDNLLEKLCSKYKQNVQKLEITDVELRHIDGGIFGIYPNLKFVNLARNRIDMNFSKNFQEILGLDVSFNNLEILENWFFGNLTNLKILNLSFNEIENINLALSPLSNLEELNLNFNKLKILDGKEFNFLKNLKILNLAHNLISKFVDDLSIFGLRELYLNDNQLILVNRDNFVNVPNLRILDFKNNLIKNLEINVSSETQISYEKNNGNIFDSWAESLRQQNNFGNFLRSQPSNNFQVNNQFANLGSNPQDNLESKQQKPGLFLVFGANPFATQAPITQKDVSLIGRKLDRDVNAWSKIQNLDFSKNQINLISDFFFNNLNDLRCLNISYNKINKFELSWLGDSFKLNVFDIRNNSLTNLDFDFVKQKFGFLKKIDFDVELIKCEHNTEILRYLEKNRIIVGNCNTRDKCCGIILN